MQEITITIDTPAVWDEAMKRTEYTGANAAGGADIYDAVRLTASDRHNFPALLAEAQAALADTFAELLTGIETTGKAVTLSLRMADAWDTNLAGHVRGTLTQYFADYILSRWFGLVSPDAAQAYTDGATAQLDLAASLLWARRRPGRPKRHVKEEEE